MFIYFHFCRGPGAPAARLPLASVHSRMPRGHSDGISAVHYVSRCITIFFFFFETALNNSNFNTGTKGSVSPCTRTLKSNPKENPTGVGVRRNHVLFLPEMRRFFCSVLFFFLLQEAAETVAGPSL